MEGVVVEQPAEPEAVRATTAGEVFCISEQTVSVPPGNVGLTFEGLCLVFAIGVVLIFACRRRRAQPST